LQRWGGVAQVQANEDGDALPGGVGPQVAQQFCLQTGVRHAAIAILLGASYAGYAWARWQK